MNFFLKKNIFFFIFIFFLIFFFYSYFINSNKGALNLKKPIEKNFNELNSSTRENKFFNVEYKFIDEKNNIYTTISQQASFDVDNPNLINMIKVFSYTNLKDTTKLEVRSEEAIYDKTTKNIKYNKKVVINNKNYKIFCNNAEYNSKKSLIYLKGNIIVKDENNTIKSDVAKINLNTNNIEMSMISQRDQVYGKKEN